METNDSFFGGCVEMTTKLPVRKAGEVMRRKAYFHLLAITKCKNVLCLAALCKFLSTAFLNIDAHQQFFLIFLKGGGGGGINTYSRPQHSNLRMLPGRKNF